jgi:hypothetical protein
MSEMIKKKRHFKVIVLSLVVLLAAFVVVNLAQYWLIDMAYDRLISLDPKTRTDVVVALNGFRETRITDPAVAAPLLRAQLTGTNAYFRYTRYGGAIDVVYDKDGKVTRIWPEYE